MISGVIFMLFGEALVLRSPPHAVWAVVFLLINVVYLPLLEEPMLVARFGEPYRRYKEHVPRLVPRARPWSPDFREGNGAR
jgi:protein-S-isoprenylcysteine O-methyltransferase Ste14